MTVDQELISLLVCPNCRGEIQYREAEQVIACMGECRLVYPVVDDIPHMLVEEARKADAP